jgi:hypothetical protein
VIGPMNDHEEAFVRAFIVKERQERYRGFLSTPRHRQKLLRELYHRLAINPSLAVEVHSRDRTVEKVESRLRAKGAPSEVYVISPSSDLDQRWLTLTAALEETHAGSAAIVCCTLGELAFYRSEESAWILSVNHTLRLPVS